MRATRMIAVTLAGGVSLALSAACSGGGAAPAREPQAAAPSPDPPTPEAVPTHPFTGQAGAARRRVLAVKIENTEAGQPQMGVKSADIVYVTQVEGGLTRLIAMFSSKMPARVGPVRSARISDLHVLSQFGKPALAYSGVQTKMIPFVREASLFDVSDSTAPSAYFREPGRFAPYNLFARTRRLLAEAPKATRAKDVGYTFGEAPEGGVARTGFSVKYPAAQFTFRWSKAQNRWLIWQDGKRNMAAEGGQLGAPTVVVQYVSTTRSQFHDVNGSYTPLLKTVGKGRAVVLRDGMAYKARWSRAAEKEGTTFTTESGEPMPFAEGQVWVVLAAPKPVQP